ncbi:MAG TPA: LPS export ABC transporter permease LptF [Candidatus Binataceae bacterium]|nr:LPS export ABC transporter permease LptF [Candidatus Binataceae bacterium]
MRTPGFTTIDRYIAREVLGPFAMGVGLLTFALVTGKLLKLTEMVVNHGVSLAQVAGLMGYIMPAFLELTFPMAVLLGVLLGFGRMSGDRELIAARACGISLYRLAIPVLAASFAIYIVASWFAFSVRPWANAHLQDEIVRMSRTQSTAGLREKIFNSDFAGIVLYVDHISSSDDSLRGVLISDARDSNQQNTIIARRGIILPDRGLKTITLRLFNGSIFGVQAASNVSHVTSFRVYDLNIEPQEDVGLVSHAPESMTYSELRSDIAAARTAGKPDYIAEAEMAAKYTVPFATLLFGILGMPLGLKPARGGQSERFGVAIAMFFFYYMLMRFGQSLAERGSLNAYAAMSIPDLAFAFLAVRFFHRAATDRSDEGRGPGDLIWDFIERFERRKAAA